MVTHGAAPNASPKFLWPAPQRLCSPNRPHTGIVRALRALRYANGGCANGHGNDSPLAELALALVPGNPTDLYACEIPLVNASPSRPGSNIHTPRKAAPRPRSMHRCHTRLADLATPQPYPCGPRGSHPSPPLGRHPYLPLRRSRFPDYRPVDACARRSPEPSSEITLIPLAS